MFGLCCVKRKRSWTACGVNAILPVSAISVGQATSYLAAPATLKNNGRQTSQSESETRLGLHNGKYLQAGYSYTSFLRVL